MAEAHPHEQELREMIARREVVVVVGSGVSIATTGAAPSWEGLIESALKVCRTNRAQESWCEAVRVQLSSGHPDMLLFAAEAVQQKLREHGEGEFAGWLRRTFEELKPDDTTTIEHLGNLGVPLVTTNYDNLIEDATGLNHVTWTDSRNVSRFLRGTDRRVLHLHGHWSEPESVVLGIRSYELVKNSEHTQAVMQALGMTKSFLFVGCGEEGLSDPNWGNFLTWLEAIERQSKAEHHHFRLVREEEVFTPIGRLFPLVYGEDYGELPKILSGLCPQPEHPPDNAGTATTPVRPLADLPDNIDYYLRNLTDETSTLKLLGMGKSLQLELPIADAYVPLRTMLARSIDERKTQRFKEEPTEYAQQVELGDVFAKAAELGQRGVILLGEPGSGKTTGARQLVWRLASRQCLPEDLGLPAGMVPVFLRFRNIHRTTLERQKGGLRAFLADETECDEAPDGLGSPGDDLWNRTDGGLLWVLDGLDEIVEPEARSKVSHWIRNALQKRPNDWFLVTCRFQGYFKDGVPLGSKFVEYHVRPLDDAQVATFVRDWYGAAFTKLYGPGEKAEAEAKDKSDKLLAILARPEYQAGKIRELSTNPLLLTILCIVFLEKRQLPTERAELYAHCVRVLLEDWRRDVYDAEIGAELQRYDAEAAQAVLGRVAWWMQHQQDRTVAAMDEMAEEAAYGLATIAASSGLGRDGQAFLERMRDEAGILAMGGEGEGRCGFLHLSFQEYLAGEHAAREGFAKELAKQATESWWREVALLSLRQNRPFCETFFREMLAAGIAENHPDLAGRLLEDARYPTPEPFVEVLNARPPSKKEDRRAHDVRVAAILRLLRNRSEEVPGMEEICRRLAGSEHEETRSFASEILVRLGVMLPPVNMRLHPRIIVNEHQNMAFVEVPAGEFKMGGCKYDAEQPIHVVRITQSFLLGKYPVTNAQYAEFMDQTETRIGKPEYWDDRRFNQPDQPVVGVSWDEACAFCEWIGGRLPSEAEWEYACRAGSTTEYSFGNDADELGDHAWFSQNSNDQSQPVGAKKPNPWGLHDMHGNVWEWCADWWEDSYERRAKSTVVIDPTGPLEGPVRVGRGGSWHVPPGCCRSAYRNGYTPSFRSSSLGFRVALSSGGKQGAKPDTQSTGE